VDFTFTLLEQSLDGYTHASVEHGSVVGEGDPDPQPGKKRGKVAWVDPSVLQACVSGLPCKVKKFDSNHPFLVVIEIA
jgi:hypothetical protein